MEPGRSWDSPTPWPRERRGRRSCVLEGSTPPAASPCPGHTCRSPRAPAHRDTARNSPSLLPEVLSGPSGSVPPAVPCHWAACSPPQRAPEGHRPRGSSLQAFGAHILLPQWLGRLSLSADSDQGHGQPWHAQGSQQPGDPFFGLHLEPRPRSPGCEWGRQGDGWQSSPWAPGACRQGEAVGQGNSTHALSSVSRGGRLATPPPPTGLAKRQQVQTTACVGELLTWVPNASLCRDTWTPLRRSAPRLIDLQAGVPITHKGLRIL